MAKSDLRLVYSTFADQKSAQALACKIIQEKLAACVNLLATQASVYEWQDKIVTEKEVVMLAKTTHRKAKKLVAFLEKHHPYVCPCILVIKTEDALPAYQEWVKEQVR